MHANTDTLLREGKTPFTHFLCIARVAGLQPVPFSGRPGDGRWTCKTVRRCGGEIVFDQEHAWDRHHDVLAFARPCGDRQQ
jgi:hypothetical protein